MRTSSRRRSTVFVIAAPLLAECPRVDCFKCVLQNKLRDHLSAADILAEGPGRLFSGYCFPAVCPAHGSRAFSRTDRVRV